MAAQHCSISVSIYVALVGYVVTVCLLLSGLNERYSNRLARTIWSMACFSFIAHVLAAFHYAYHWSHQEAVRTTALQTQELLGMAFGQGLYFNYLFLLLWLADVIIWWLNPPGYLSRPKWVTLVIHGFLSFIVFNGVVIFKSGGIRIAGLIATGLVIVLAIRKLLIGSTACS